MEKKEIIVIMVLFLLALSFSFYYNNFSNLDVSEVCFPGACFVVEIADSNEERQRGLMFRETLDRGKGMLFVFEEEGKHVFWMKNTLIPLDIIWINSDMEVVYITNAVPCITEECLTYGPEEDALYVLEVNSGVSGEIGLEVGARIKLVLRAN